MKWMKNRKIVRYLLFLKFTKKIGNMSLKKVVKRGRGQSMLQYDTDQYILSGRILRNLIQ